LFATATIQRREPLKAAVLSSQPLGLGEIAEPRERRAHRLELVPLPPLVGGAERDDVAASLDRRDPRLELDAFRARVVEIDRVEARVDDRPPALEREPTRLEDVVERREALLPLIEVLDQELQVAEILQRLLESVRRQELVEVAAFLRIRHRVEAVIPSRRLRVRVLEQRIDQRAASHGRDRAFDALDLRI